MQAVNAVTAATGATAVSGAPRARFISTLCDGADGDVHCARPPPSATARKERFCVVGAGLPIKALVVPSMRLQSAPLAGYVRLARERRTDETGPWHSEEVASLLDGGARDTVSAWQRASALPKWPERLERSERLEWSDWSPVVLKANAQDRLVVRYDRMEVLKLTGTVSNSAVQPRIVEGLWLRHAPGTERVQWSARLRDVGVASSCIDDNDIASEVAVEATCLPSHATSFEEHEILALRAVGAALRLRLPHRNLDNALDHLLSAERVSAFFKEWKACNGATVYFREAGLCERCTEDYDGGDDDELINLRPLCIGAASVSVAPSSSKNESVDVRVSHFCFDPQTHAFCSRREEDSSDLASHTDASTICDAEALVRRFGASARLVYAARRVSAR
jgi:hypothetical protein